MPANSLASSNGSVSKPLLSNKISGLATETDGTTRSLNRVNVISVPTPSTSQVPLEYLEGNTFPVNSMTRPLERTIPLLLVYCDLPTISLSTLMLVFDSMSSMINWPNMLTSTKLW